MLWVKENLDYSIRANHAAIIRNWNPKEWWYRKKTIHVFNVYAVCSLHMYSWSRYIYGWRLWTHVCSLYAHACSTFIGNVILLTSVELCGGRAQFLPSALKAPHMTAYMTISRFSAVKRLLNKVDSFTPTARITTKLRKFIVRWSWFWSSLKMWWLILDGGLVGTLTMLIMEW